MTYLRRTFTPALLVTGLTGLLLVELAGFGHSDPNPTPVPVNAVEFIPNQLGAPPAPGGVSRNDAPIGQVELASASSISVEAADWLGPAAPLALSPFFGMTCLSGLAIWGPEWMPASGWLDTSGPLNNRWVFWIFLTLTVFTSLPRFMKVTKPLAQLAEQAETWSVLVMLLVVRIMAEATPDSAVAIPSVEPVFMAAGIGQVTTDMFLYIALLINVIVINGVKVCFELLIWMAPFPFIDAIFETANKSVCAALMALYAFSPFLALILNLFLFVLAAIVFRWVTRISSFYRTILMDYAMATLLGKKWQPGQRPITGFNSNAWKGIPPRSRMSLNRVEGGWTVCRMGWFFSGRVVELGEKEYRLEIMPGTLTSDLILAGPEGESLLLVITRRYLEGIPDLAKQLNGRIVARQAEPATA